jgi:tripartite-type tricarboxylate transporter receptor subunit TctC
MTKFVALTNRERGLHRRRFLHRAISLTAKISLAAGGVVLCVSAAQAQAYPSRPIKIVVAYAPAGSTDAVARMVGQELSAAMGVPVIIENRPGGGTLIGTEAAAHAAPDGYTLFFGTNAMVITPLLNEKVGYDPVTSFSPIGLVTFQSLGVLMNPRLKIDSIPALIAYAKKNPGKINFASSGNGSAQQLAGDAFRVATGVDITHVAYKGAGPAVIDLLGGHVDLMFTSLVGNMDFVKDGKLSLLATTGLSRTSATPNVKTVAESVPGYEVKPWQALFAPTNTSKPILDRLSAEMRKIGQSPAIRKKLAEQGMDLHVSSPEELKSLVLSERQSYGALIKKTGTKIN